MTEKQLQTENLKNEFLIQMKETRGNVLRSCETVGASRATMLRHYQKDREFREKWDLVAKGELKQKGNISTSDRLEPADASTSKNQAKASNFDTKLKPERNIASHLTKLNNSDLTKPDLSEDKNPEKPSISERENSTKLYIENDKNEVRADNFDTNSEIEKASKSKRFFVKNTEEILNVSKGNSAQFAQPLKKENYAQSAHSLKKEDESVQESSPKQSLIARLRRITITLKE